MTLLSKKPLWFHILLALALVFTLLFLFVVSLNWITKHGESSTVPMVTGKKLDDVQALLEEKGFELIIQDSVFYDSIPRGMVLRQ
ncbi:MAG: PASTA domain-containing protein, partial [Chitinophagaceae bacterium]